MTASLIPQDPVVNLEAAKQAAVVLLTALAAHNVAGAELILTAVKSTEVIIEQCKAHYDELMIILKALEPFYEIARDWLIDGWNHLVDLFDWAKAKWQELFGEN